MSDLVAISPTPSDRVSTSPFSTESVVVVSPEAQNRLLSTNMNEVPSPFNNIVLHFGLENFVPEAHDDFWEEQRLGDYYRFSTMSTNTHDFVTGWQYLRSEIVTYINRSVSKMLTNEQIDLFRPDNHLQIYLTTTDKGFRKVLRGNSYEQTFYDLYNYVIRNHCADNNFLCIYIVLFTDFYDESLCADF
jgi:hypothetical protein